MFAVAAVAGNHFCLLFLFRFLLVYNAWQHAVEFANNNGVSIGEDDEGWSGGVTWHDSLRNNRE